MDFAPTIDIERAFGVRFGSYDDVNVFCPFHENANTSTTKSCSVNRLGMFKCQGCGTSGTALEFFMQREGIENQEVASRQLEDTAMSRASRESRRSTKTVTTQPLGISLVNEMHADLVKNPKWMGYLQGKRGLTLDTLRAFSIGCDETRLTIPIFDRDRSVRNIRRYYPGKTPKILTHPQGDGTPCLFPLSVLDSLQTEDELILCEGEWDCMLLDQHGFNAITHTGGVHVWEDSWTTLLTPYKIVIMFDVNDSDNIGQEMAQLRANEFRAAGATVTVVELPLTNKGGDVTDWFVSGRTSQELRQVIDRTNETDETGIPNNPPPPTITGIADEPDKTPPKYPIVSLQDSVSARHYFKPVTIKAVVAGKGQSPFVVPYKMVIEVYDVNKGTTTKQLTIDLWNGTILTLLQCTEVQQKAVIKKLIFAPSTASIAITVLETINVDLVYLIPCIDETAGSYVLRQGYYIGHSLETNRTYEFVGYLLPSPKDQSATHILVEAKPSDTSLDGFSLSARMHNRLKQTFTTDNTFDKLGHISAELAEHVTRIYGRNVLHTAVDLVFHSPRSFVFNGVEVRKGWLEALIIGDTRTGKGFVAEGLANHYGVSEVVSGENVTAAGLIGGVQKIGDRWTLVWGKIPLADRRMVIIDECSSLSLTDIGKLSRIRSEGVAEITKIVTERTRARTRLLWLSNPRAYNNQPRSLSDYNHGIESITDLIGQAEDIARFDYALTVAQGEVSSDEINKKHSAKGVPVYTSDLCHQLIMWIWSRRPDQIVFQSKLDQVVFNAAKALGRQFSPSIPLIQREDVRFKLLRIACAVAGRTYSTKDGENLLVTKQHVDFAYNFLTHIYNTPSSGYARYSAADREQSELRNEKLVRTTLQQCGEYTSDIVEGLLETHYISVADISDYGGCDPFQARYLIAALVRAGAIVRHTRGNTYRKRPAFKMFLQRMLSSMTTDAPVTQEE